MDIIDIRSKPSQELKETLINLRKEFVNLIFQKKLGQCSNISRFNLIRKSIARILTVLNERRGEEKDA
ncbi:50S ribosomal protein L29 [Wolbachia endosymbiont of Pentalonia nigronervosa]|jgi:large subunit ribosomal protein L29|uniref:50S ribosomal protein L29 n=1 Tax=Wolbachia endosymbiont of Pentalonia nigronervosa TaxID=1301914 RepID=UPI00165F7987|nr:50S ribosomal protein L29 [Wolbachia endosymbiont of Pentalonia nigronervosa]MBD0391284.1 50S ribosomal protein L29 [Wolbachia endosymbiont of Pentalonia nigronervosa]